MRYKIGIPAPNLSGEIPLVFSKSISNRALIIRSLCDRKFNIQNLSDSNDTQLMQQALQGHDRVVDIEDAGTCMRFLTAYFSVHEGKKIIQCSDRMKERPIGILVNALQKLGADIVYLENEGFPPLKITGKKLSGESLQLKGNTSSQYITALLLIAPLLPKGLHLKLSGRIVSRPYIEMTLRIMKVFGIMSNFSEDEIMVLPQSYQPVNFSVEADWSAASYWFSMLAMAEKGEIMLKNLHEKSTQGDAAQVGLFKKLGVDTQFMEKGIHLTKNFKKVREFIHNFNQTPDLVQTFAVCCAFLNIPFIFSGLETLKIKETDRVKALITELKKFGFILSEPEPNVLAWDGKKMPPKKEIVVKTYGDHRMAMAFTPIVMKRKDLVIENPEVVKKSYPRFWEHLKQAGFEIKVCPRV